MLQDAQLLGSPVPQSSQAQDDDRKIHFQPPSKTDQQVINPNIITLDQNYHAAAR